MPSTPTPLLLNANIFFCSFFGSLVAASFYSGPLFFLASVSCVSPLISLSLLLFTYARSGRERGYQKETVREERDWQVLRHSIVVVLMHIDVRTMSVCIQWESDLASSSQNLYKPCLRSLSHEPGLRTKGSISHSANESMPIRISVFSVCRSNMAKKGLAMIKVNELWKSNNNEDLARTCSALTSNWKTIPFGYFSPVIRIVN